jgi:peptide/nickel transport system permease protein
MVPVLLCLTAVIFLLNHMSPIDPARAALGPAASPSAVQELREELWLDRSLPAQYVHYLDRLILHGDLGFSARLQQPVADSLRRTVPVTAELAICAFFIATCLALLLALAAAARWRGASLIRVGMIGLASAPAFLLGIAGILLFFSELGVLPASGQTGYENTPTGPTGMLIVDSLLHGQTAVFFDSLQYILLPAFCVALVPAVAVGRTLQSSLLTTLNSDYIRTARSKGLPERTIVWRHGLRNSVGPALSMLGLQTGLMFAGIVVVETIFAWPGIGLYASQAIPVGDFGAIAGVALVIGVAYVVINFVVDVLQATADPRIRL